MPAFACIVSRVKLRYSGVQSFSFLTMKPQIANDIRFLGSGPRCGLGELSLPENEPGGFRLVASPKTKSSVHAACAPVTEFTPTTAVPRSHHRRCSQSPFGVVAEAELLSLAPYSGVISWVILFTPETRRRAVVRIVRLCACREAPNKLGGNPSC